MPDGPDQYNRQPFLACVTRNGRCLLECIFWVEHGPTPHCLPGCCLEFDLKPMTEVDLLRDGQRAGRAATMDLDAIIISIVLHRMDENGEVARQTELPEGFKRDLGPSLSVSPVTPGYPQLGRDHRIESQLKTTDPVRGSGGGH